MNSGGGRVSIPSSTKEMIQNIKEIAGSHSDEEIYIMLKECNMDPNETTQKLLLQDTFHEVKRKRDRKKENVNKDSAESRWKPGMQGRGNRGGRGNYPFRYASHDAGGGRNSASGKENGTNQVPEESVGVSTQPNPHDIKNKETCVASSTTVITDGPVGIASENTSVVQAVHQFAGGGNNQSVVAAADITKLEGPPPLNSPVEANEASGSTISFVGGEAHGQLMQTSSNIPTSRTSAPSPRVYFSASDPVLVSSQDSWLLGAVGTIRREVGSQQIPPDQIPPEQIPVVPAEVQLITVSSEVGSSFMQGKMANKSQLVSNNQLSESSQSAPSTHGGPSVSRPSSSYTSRSPQVIGPQKVGPSKEWKPKPTNCNLAQGPWTVVSSEVPAVPVEGKAHSQPAAIALDSKEAISDLDKKLEQLHISDSQHVIIPNHLHVPEIEKLGFCFGSFDANFNLNTSYSSGPENDKSPPSETSEGIEASVEQLSNQNALATAEVDYTDYPPSSSHVPESLTSADGQFSSSVVPVYSESKQETDLPPEGHQYSVVHTSPNYSYGIMPPMVGGGPIAPIESTESQARDVSGLPSFVVQQPFNPTSYYAQFYRSGANSDGRISPFHSAGISTKYNGNVSMLSPQASQSSQEAGNSLLLSTTGPTPLVTQAAGVVQSSIAVTQQPLPVFRQPAGMHLPHYPTNYIPYGHYFSPFYLPHPAIHQFLSNGTFTPQPQAGSVYPAPPVATTKYSLPQYKPGSNTGNSTHMGVPANYGPYGSSPTGFNPNSVTTTGNSTSNEDLVASQFKENNVYITGQQSEGSGIWIAAPGRDISSLQASSFYNLPQAQMAFTATQAGHGSFAGIYHPAQPVTAAAVRPLLQQSQTMAGAVDMAELTAGVYQPSQPAPINWPNKY